MKEFANDCPLNPHLDGVDGVVAQVKPLQAVQVQEAAAVQHRQPVVWELQLTQQGQARREALTQYRDAVPTQVQLLQELQLGEGTVRHRTDVVVLQQQHAQLAILGKGACRQGRDAVVGQVQELAGGRHPAGQLGEERLGADGELQVTSAVATRGAPTAAAAAAAPGGQRHHQEEEEQRLHGSSTLCKNTEMLFNPIKPPQDDGNKNNKTPVTIDNQEML